MKSLENLFKRAQAYSRKGNFLKSFSIYKKILQRGDADTEGLAQAFAEAGSCLLNLRIYDEAEDYLRQALRLDPLDGGCHYLLGTALTKLFRFQEAVFEYKIARKLDPKNAEIARSLGWAVFMSGEVKTGEKLLRESLRLNPHNIFAYCDLAVLYINNHQYRKAEKVLKEAERYRPQDPLVEDVVLACRGLKKAWEEVRAIKRLRGGKGKKKQLGFSL